MPSSEAMACRSASGLSTKAERSSTGMVLLSGLNRWAPAALASAAGDLWVRYSGPAARTLADPSAGRSGRLAAQRLREARVGGQLAAAGQHVADGDEVGRGPDIVQAEDMPAGIEAPRQ